MTITLDLDAELDADDLALIASGAAAADESGHLDPDVVAALAATGINRLLLPTELGGLAAAPRRCGRSRRTTRRRRRQHGVGGGHRVRHEPLRRVPPARRRRRGVRRPRPVERVDVRPD